MTNSPSTKRTRRIVDVIAARVQVALGETQKCVLEIAHDRACSSSPLEVVRVLDSSTCGSGLTVPEFGRADRGRRPRLSGFCSQQIWIWPCFDQWTIG